MPSKEEVIASIVNKPTFSQKEVLHLINSVTATERTWFKPDVIKKGDVYSYKQGDKPRLIVVFKVQNSVCYGLALSSTQDEMNLCPSERARFLTIDKSTFFSRGIVCAKAEFVKEKFVCTYDNMKDLNNAIRELKKDMAGLLKLKLS